MSDEDFSLTEVEMLRLELAETRLAQAQTTAVAADPACQQLGSALAQMRAALAEKYTEGGKYEIVRGNASAIDPKSGAGKRRLVVKE